MKFNLNVLNKFWLIFLTLLSIFIYFIPNEILYPKYKFTDWIVFILLFIVLPFTVMKTLESINYKTYPTKLLGICALSILIVGPTFGFFQNYRKEKELKKNGKETECYVIDKKKSKNDWLINCKYFVKETEYLTYYETEEETVTKIGDTLKLIYNQKYPRMYKLKLNKEK